MFHTDDLTDELQMSINATEMARRRFRDIAAIAGLIFKGYPGSWKKRNTSRAVQGFFLTSLPSTNPIVCCSSKPTMRYFASNSKPSASALLWNASTGSTSSCKGLLKLRPSVFLCSLTGCGTRQLRATC
ncbi:MAG: hypothetical protein HC821_00025 [Lewinella sp.]|nr:hypothetical protein [Lewinella sp.]